VAEETTFTNPAGAANAAAGASSSDKSGAPVGDSPKSGTRAGARSFLRKKRHIATLGLLVAIVGTALWLTYGGVFGRPKGAQAGTPASTTPAPTTSAPATQPAKGQVTVTKAPVKASSTGAEQPASRPAARGATTGAETKPEKKPSTKLSLGAGDKQGFKQTAKPATRPAQ
jgi:hypothetical protein